MEQENDTSTLSYLEVQTIQVLIRPTNLLIVFTVNDLKKS